MPQWTPQKRAAFDALADEFLANYDKGRTFLAVDGLDGAGQSAFADALAERLGRGGHAVFRASIDRFHRPRAERYARGEDSAEGYYSDSFDYELFRRVLSEPFRLAGSTGFVTGAFDVERDLPLELEWQTGPQDATLVVDGVFLNRPELRGLWNYSIWLESPSATLPRRAREAGGQKLYLAEANPRERASAIVDYSNPDLPVRVFVDSC